MSDASARRDRRPSRLVRFDAVQRCAHWATALLFTILILTALALYFPSVEVFVGRHLLVEQIHVWAGIALPVPILVSIAGPWGKRMRRDMRRFNRWTRGEIRWLRSGRSGYADLDKFNPGQKLNAIFVGAAIVLMLASGVVLKWFDLFPLGWRSGATFVHEVLALCIVIVVVGHIAMAVTHRDSLRSMLRGWVTVTWAQRHAPRWLRDELDVGRAGSAPAEVGAAGAAGMRRGVRDARPAGRRAEP